MKQFLLFFCLFVALKSFSQQTIFDVLSTDFTYGQKNSSNNNLTRDSNNQEFLKNKEKSPVEFINYTNRFNPALSTNDPNVWFFIHNDTNNIWQIGKPNKPPLDTTFYQPNALITDTINPYSVNNHSVFELRAKKPISWPYLCWSRMDLSFAYIADVDSARDGLYIEVSYNDSGTWTNIINDTFADIVGSAAFNNFPDDTLCNGEWGISHLHQSIPAWFSYFEVGWEWYEQNGTQFLVDSVAFRFHFVSDSINSGKQGIEIMAIHLSVRHMCGVSIEDNTMGNTILYPNPVVFSSIINLNKYDKYEIRVFDITGRTMLFDCFSGNEYKIGQNVFLSGYYYYIITSSNSLKIQGSFIVN
jgi:hypothetical protein